MSAWRTAWAEFIGLFVDDGWFAALVLGWVVLCAVTLPRWMPGPAGGVVLFAGLAVILVGGAWRRARR